MLNKVQFIGRLTKDPEMKYSQNGTAVATFSVAVRRNYKNTQGEYEADFFDIKCFRRLAETVANNLTKGRMVYVEAHLQNNRYENSEGKKVYSNDIVADDVQFLDAPKS